MTQTYDHIVVGGGAAGCVVAARLVKAGRRVLLLEAGHSHHHPLLDMPPGIFKMINGSKFMRYYRTEPQQHLDGRQHEISQGNVLGGGTSVNAQVYMRGRASDYDEWDELLRGNNAGIRWNWQAVLPYFTGMEGNDRLGGDLHGSEGPLLVSDPGHIDDVSRWFVQAVQRLGLPYNHDFNGPSQRGVGFYQFMNRRGKRSSAAYAFIEPLAKDPRLTLRLNSAARQLLIQNERAKGVIYTDQSGTEHEAYADGDVIVSSGALVSPKLLMLSGIGPAEELSRHDIACVVDLPGVGQNLIDHPEVPIIATANGPYGYFKQGQGWRMIKNGLHFKLFGAGTILSAGVEAGAFVNPTDPNDEPTIQAFCVPHVYLDRDILTLVENTYGLTVTTVVVKPKSRGFVKLRSADPNDMPVVSPHLLKHQDDMKQMIAGQRYFLKAFHAKPLADRIKAVAVPREDDLSDAALERHCKRFVKTNYHPAGTCRMGPDSDRMAVLDAAMRVRGIENLRVADMSVCPNINAGNTAAPAMMLGDRCADFILEAGAVTQSRAESASELT
ncbi:GMC family oxidoreductase [Mesorhizobium sp. CA8]|uniref:GMC family oxidoreductase n=1 Tax=unclassified Mesorhizobium TaxID=325217 RepID=UPI001CCF8322|nr:MULTISPECIES: GMC family oxidoreductase [unclassified Mesorhizobium]MBZ9759734.1 GMC family oxidoreductase [Mesorhizobium sp. CA8]MBZ9819710.1 GMC family oxidoreductase [Mesorhizobium sp. CA4]